MPVPSRRTPRIPPFRRSRFSFRTELPARAAARAGRKVRGLIVVAASMLAWAGNGPAFAQAPAPAPAPAPAAAAPTSAQAPAAEPLNFGKPRTPDTVSAEDAASPWSAPEPWRTDNWYFQFAYYTLHFHYDPAHQQSYLFDAEYHFKETWLGGQWIAGMALFQNSFGQFSQYIFGGLVWRPVEDLQPFYVKLTAGPLHGYTGQYRDKVPFNSSGVAPAIIPGIGYCVQRRYCGDFVLLGTNAALLTIGMTVP